MQQRAAATALGWTVIAWECLFPLAWLDPHLCLGMLACGAVFHAANLWVFGLNRFFWAWLAGYPAVLAGCQLLSR
jgi:hypothetical protein